jgi:DNA-binding NarL/FixJ family response regulator
MQGVTPIRVAIVEDEVLVASMLSAWVSRNEHFTFAGAAHNGREGLQLCLQTRPDVALIDVMMPDMDGIALAEALLKEIPGIKIVILSARLDPYCIHRIQRLGIPGYVDKSSTPDVVTEAILAVARGETFQTPGYSARLQQLRSDPAAFFKILSGREVDVLRLLTKGYNLEQIGKQMGVTFHTARTHLRNIRKKLDVHNTLDLLSHAKKNGFF